MTPGDRLRAVHGALVDGFDLAALDELTTLHLGTPLEQIVGAGCDLNGAATGLVKWARQQGRLADLVRGMLSINPGNAQVQAAALAGWTDERGAAQESGMSGRALQPVGENGVQHAIGTLEAQVAGLEKSVADLRAGQRLMTWFLAVSIAMNGALMIALASHMGLWA